MRESTVVLAKTLKGIQYNWPGRLSPLRKQRHRQKP